MSGQTHELDGRLRGRRVLCAAAVLVELFFFFLNQGNGEQHQISTSVSGTHLKHSVIKLN